VSPPRASRGASGLFDSSTFFVCLLVVLAAHRLLAHRGPNRMRLVASDVFYGWRDWRFLSLVAFSTLVDFACARRIERRGHILPDGAGDGAQDASKWVRYASSASS
jgi:hypothetical protein